MRCIDFHMQVRLVPFYLLLKDRHHLQNPLNFNLVFPPPKKVLIFFIKKQWNLNHIETPAFCNANPCNKNNKQA